jgi:Flp pilus assembly protein TadD
VVAADVGDAVDRIDIALGLSPDDPILAARRARILLDGARTGGDEAVLAAALTAWEALAAADPNHGGHRLELGVARALAGDVAGAEAAWLAAEELAPTSPAPARNLATLYLETGEIAAAADAVARALVLDPDDAALADLAARIDEADPR